MTAATSKKSRAPRNRTLDLEKGEIDALRKRLVRLEKKSALRTVKNKVIIGDAFDVLDHLPANRFDLLFADPPYNLSKNFGKSAFKQRSLEEYQSWLESWIRKCLPLLRKTASIYLCGDWRSASAIQRVGMKYFRLRNRITWEREKGRGAKSNWKNTAEDIWFFTVSDDYHFDADAVKMKRRVVAPYKEKGMPKDWKEGENGNFRLTAPSNLWNDITVPFWSMPENTDHPTQKPEKLLAKILLASTKKDDLILDPFLGSGTTAVVARKLKRSFVGIEVDEKYCLLAEKRLELASKDSTIQGFSDGVFWERNTKATTQ